jgi:uncharacterized protein (UPF0335 family)
VKTFEINFKPLVLSIPEEREQLYKRLKDLIARCESIAYSVKPLDELVRLRAISVLANLVRVAASLVEDMQLDELQGEIESLEREVEEEKRPERL